MMELESTIEAEIVITPEERCVVKWRGISPIRIFKPFVVARGCNDGIDFDPAWNTRLRIDSAVKGINLSATRVCDDA
jgi:hypothetical protein